MDQLWSPWRMEYIQRKSSEPGCVFCNAAAAADGAGNLILLRGVHAFIILNRYPYTSGHLMVVPFAHIPVLDALGEAARAEMMELTNVCVHLLTTIYHPQGFNIGINMGEAAGAGIAEHIHLHVVPRWMGDTNFMASVGMIRVLPEALDDSYQRLLAAWQNFKEERR